MRYEIHGRVAAWLHDECITRALAAAPVLVLTGV
jgi:hypothetical protein